MRLSHSFRALCATLFFISNINGSTIPLKRGGEAKVLGGNSTYVGSQVNGQEVFLGIPFAQPPVGDLRFRKPQPMTPSPMINAQRYGARCLQSTIADNASEDCLTLNIWRPRGINGGSFILGESESYPGYGIVGTSIATNRSIVYVSFNYRLGFFGFPVGKQTMNKGATNLGLYDQRMAIEWVQRNIQYFGGDPNKVTLFGESAGAISVSYQMMYRGGQIGSAFRAAIMESGAPSSFISTSQNSKIRQDAYDHIASQTGCRKARDSFECLRSLDVTTLQAAHVATYELPKKALAFANFPTAYGPVTLNGDDFLPTTPSILIQSGKYANIPIVSGSNLDEGTWFVADPDSSLDIIAFLNSERPGLALDLSPIRTIQLLKLYPNTPSLGSPYGTGNELFGRDKQYKRSAAIIGDILFTAPRRQFTRHATSRGQAVWSYLFSQPSGGAPEYGVSHTSEIAYVFGGLKSDATTGDKDVSNKMMQYWINFATVLDPRPDDSNLPVWPGYGSSRSMIRIKANDYAIIPDTFRDSENSYITSKFLVEN